MEKERLMRLERDPAGAVVVACNCAPKSPKERENLRQKHGLSQARVHKEASHRTADLPASSAQGETVPTVSTSGPAATVLSTALHTQGLNSGLKTESGWEKQWASSKDKAI